MADLVDVQRDEYQPSWPILAVVGSAAIIAVGLATASLWQPALYPPTPPLSSSVTIQLTDSMGSGVHIGNGLILSAAHVAREGSEITVETSDGASREATVVWASAKYDISVIQTSSDGLAASPLSCAPPQLGQPVIAHGSPMDIGQLVTYGAIVGEAREVQEWGSVVPVDMTILPGMSGGALLSLQGEVVGISVGILAYPTLAGATVTGVGFAVPSIVVCNLLGRV